MDFYDVKPDFFCTAGSIGKGLDHGFYVFSGHFIRCFAFIVKGNGTGGNDGLIDLGFPAGVGELDGGFDTLAVGKVHNLFQPFLLPVVPQSQVTGADPSAAFHGRCFDHDQTHFSQ